MLSSSSERNWICFLTPFVQVVLVLQKVEEQGGGASGRGCRSPQPPDAWSPALEMSCRCYLCFAAVSVCARKQPAKQRRRRDEPLDEQRQDRVIWNRSRQAAVGSIIKKNSCWWYYIAENDKAAKEKSRGGDRRGNVPPVRPVHLFYNVAYSIITIVFFSQKKIS
jgi:hypothetical protein